MDKLRMGFIGAGGMASHHAKLYAENLRAKAVCICDIVEDKARKHAEALKCEYTTDPRRLIDRKDIDAVLVGAPNPLHYQFALECLHADKHVAVEYPITQTVKEYDTLRKAAARRKLVVHHALTPVIEPQPLAMKAAVGKIGKVMTTRSVYLGNARGMWYCDAAKRGNFFSALTIHQIVYYNVVLSESPDWVDAALHVYETPEYACHSGSYLCHYPSGVLGYNEWGMGFTNEIWDWAVEGEHGRLVYERPAGQPHQVRIVTGGEPEIVPIEPQASVHPKEVENFIAQVLDGAASYVSPEYSRSIIGICEASLKSAETGKRITLTN